MPQHSTSHVRLRTVSPQPSNPTPPSSTLPSRGDTPTRGIRSPSPRSQHQQFTALVFPEVQDQLSANTLEPDLTGLRTFAWPATYTPAERVTAEALSILSQQPVVHRQSPNSHPPLNKARLAAGVGTDRAKRILVVARRHGFRLAAGFAAPQRGRTARVRSWHHEGVPYCASEHGYRRQLGRLRARARLKKRRTSVDEDDGDCSVTSDGSVSSQHSAISDSGATVVCGDADPHGPLVESVEGVAGGVEEVQVQAPVEQPVTERRRVRKGGRKVPGTPEAQEGRTQRLKIIVSPETLERERKRSLESQKSSDGEKESAEEEQPKSPEGKHERAQSSQYGLRVHPKKTVKHVESAGARK